MTSSGKSPAALDEDKDGRVRVRGRGHRGEDPAEGNADDADPSVVHVVSAGQVIYPQANRVHRVPRSFFDPTRAREGASRRDKPLAPRVVDGDKNQVVPVPDGQERVPPRLPAGQDHDRRKPLPLPAAPPVRDAKEPRNLPTVGSDEADALDRGERCPLDFQRGLRRKRGSFPEEAVAKLRVPRARAGGKEPGQSEETGKPEQQWKKAAHKGL